MTSIYLDFFLGAPIFGNRRPQWSRWKRSWIALAWMGPRCLWIVGSLDRWNWENLIFSKCSLETKRKKKLEKFNVISCHSYRYGLRFNMALGLSKLNVKVWMQIMNCNIGPPTRVIYDQNSFWTMKHRLPPNVKLHFSCNLFASWRHSIGNPRLGIFVITKMFWLVVTWILFSIWDVILPIDSYFSRWLLHHQPDVYIYMYYDVDVLMWPFLRTARFWRLSTQHVLCKFCFPWLVHECIEWSGWLTLALLRGGSVGQLVVGV